MFWFVGNSYLFVQYAAHLYHSLSMMSSSDEAVAALAATARTARCHNAFFRQQQLKFLHDALRTETTSIISALRQDRAVTDEEASTEVAVALNIVKENHASINPKTELQAEYRIAKGQDAVDRTVPWGVVYIDPNTEHTPLLSVVSPLSTAIAAGNCVLLNVRLTLPYFTEPKLTIVSTAFVQSSSAALTTSHTPLAGPRSRHFPDRLFRSVSRITHPMPICAAKYAYFTSHSLSASVFKR